MAPVRGLDAAVGRGRRDRRRSRERRDRRGESKLKILPPAREAPIGLLRLEADVAAADHQGRVLPRGQADRQPHAAAVLGRDRPRRRPAPADRARRRLRLDGPCHRRGRVVDQPGHRRAWPSRSCPRPIRRAATCASRSPCSRSPAASPSRSSSSWTTRSSGPGRTPGPTSSRSRSPSTRRADFLRATAIGEDGKEANDIRFLKGPEHDDRERARGRRPAPRLRARQGQPLRQGPRRERTSRSRRTAARRRSRASRSPRSCRSRSGSSWTAPARWRSRCRSSTTRRAELFRGLIRDKDKGFVIEFREQPQMIQELTGDSAALQRASRETSARGATALYDSIVLGLYQFRTLQGRKALIVVTDGADNHSHVDFPTLLRYARSGGAPIYFIARRHLGARLRHPQGDQRDRAGIRRRGVPHLGAPPRSAR